MSGMDAQRIREIGARLEALIGALNRPDATGPSADAAKTLEALAGDACAAAAAIRWDLAHALGEETAPSAVGGWQYVGAGIYHVGAANQAAKEMKA